MDDVHIAQFAALLRTFKQHGGKSSSPFMTASCSTTSPLN